MLTHILENIICSEFEKSVGRWQSKEEKQHAMKLTFSLSTEYEVEEGYRHLDIIIFADANYVTVAAKERWNVIPNAEIEYEDGESFIGHGSKGYREGDTGWKLVAHHDSCWRDGVGRLIRDKRISSIDYLFKGWYEKIEMTSELLETIHDIQDAYNDRSKLYAPDKNGVVHFLKDGKEFTTMQNQ